METHITVIGAGFCGTALVRALAQTADAQVRITLVGVADTFGSGIAYGAARPEHLLNVRAKDLGIDAQAPGAFADTLHLGESGRLEFLPRLAYGDYLRSELDAAVSSAQASVMRLSQEAVAVERVRKGFRVFLANGDAFQSDRVVLAVGALQPQALAGIGPRLSVHPRYIGWPWQGDALARLSPDDDVLIVGAGLTMVDVALTLHTRGHRGRLLAISRRGLAPQAHLRQPGAALELPPHLQRALKDADLRGLLRGVRQLSAVVDDWRRVVDALRPHLQPLWQRLELPQRARFLRHLRPYWEVARHRVAPGAAEQLAQLQASGQLQIVSARLLRARWVPDGVEAVIRPRGAADAQTGHYDAVIRATGLDTDIDRTSDPLIAGMREAGLLRADPLGLGVDTDAQLRVRDSAGQIVPGLYCVGPLLRGRYWEITAVPELRVATRALADRLLLGATPALQPTPEHVPREVNARL
ncbi:FAD-binding protein [Xanthomonas phaseoli pv. phaseoli]|uniref:FAD/NAD(P)-binding protein n=1 Tax=Xanthomonas phaseoli TaxID=1985254 RepID=UPI000595C6A4|nr:FAD/NAD(P)-binding protein [Xanthomonas phaseoli]KII98718.1 pyridine nucleotide-disulfide oxidoreductase [Xanthomonas phaseoli pv. phaseoli]QWN30524.1 FAD-binding protein [Xanthomonas phaseoli pv. phaseoli]UZB29080.1 FAD/NAD(P)-binding protein [Xanthomonas phaseoli pv. phaseoli]